MNGDHEEGARVTRPWPDPTQRTIESSQRELAQLERRLLDRLAALEKSQEKFEASITRVPTEVQQAVKQLREFLESKIDANLRLSEAQAKASEAAIGKTERSVEDRLKEISALFRSEIGSLDDKIGENRHRLDQIESRHAGAVDARMVAQDTQKLWIAVVGVILTMAVLFTGVVTFLNRPQPVQRVIERPLTPSAMAIPRPGWYISQQQDTGPS